MICADSSPATSPLTLSARHQGPSLFPEWGLSFALCLSVHVLPSAWNGLHSSPHPPVTINTLLLPGQLKPKVF